MFSRFRYRVAPTVLLLVFLAALSLGANRYENATGNGCVVYVHGTSTLHDWTVRGRTVKGTLALGPEVSLDPDKLMPGEVGAEMTLEIPAKSLISIKDNGKPYSRKMDRTMYEKLLADDHPTITFTLKRLVFKERREGREPAMLFDAEGEVSAAGVTKRVTMPVEVFSRDGRKVKIKGAVWMKMGDFKIEPPRNLLVLTTGDEVRVEFEWIADRTVER
jgi:hypothetical protein